MNRFGLSESEVELILGVLRRHKKVSSAKIFGSRAKGKFQPSSDIDLALWGGLSSQTLAAIAGELNELSLPYTFDVLSYESISHPPVREHIDRVGQILYKQTKDMPLPTHTAALFDEAVDRAGELLRAGELVALPTETVYGLAANAFDADAVAKIYEVKGRPPTNPIIVHVADFEMAHRCVEQWPAVADKLARAFWPGPLTMVLPKSKLIPGIVTAGGPTVGIRWPSHPFIQAVIRKCGFPLAAPSANPSNAVSPTTAQHVFESLGSKIALVVDGGPSQVGIESTVLDLVSAPARVLRPGMISATALHSVLGAKGLAEGPGSEKVLRSPGMLKKHYSPKARLVILSWRDETDLRNQLAGFAPENTCVLAHSQIPAGRDWRAVSVLAHDPAAYARAMYAELIQCDVSGASCIVVEQPPATDVWRGIADRLARASASGG